MIDAMIQLVGVPSDLPYFTGNDWTAAFACAAESHSGPKFEPSDVVQIIATAAGENAGDSWVGVFELADGRFGYLSAWCDYTGWDCSSGGHMEVRNTLEEIIREACTDDDRARMDLHLTEDSQ